MAGVKVFGSEDARGETWRPLLVDSSGHPLIREIATGDVLYCGTATGGDATSLEDASKDFGFLEEWRYCILEVAIGGVEYRVPIISHTSNTLYFDALPAAVVIGCPYDIRKKVSEGVRPAIYNVAITDGNTEYSQALPSLTKKFLMHCRDGTAFRIAFETGKVATPTEPYFSVPTNQAYYEDFLEAASLTLYFACAGGAGINKSMEIIAWT